jgi:type II secretory pathway component PulF
MVMNMSEAPIQMSERQARMAKFWRKFLRLTRGRVTVLRALEVIAIEEKDQSFQGVVKDIRSHVDRGMVMSEALIKHAGEFSPSIVELIKTEEKTGAWDEILQELVDGLQDGTFE